MKCIKYATKMNGFESSAWVCVRVAVEWSNKTKCCNQKK